MATQFTYKSVALDQSGGLVRCECTTRTEYLDALKVLATIHDWKRIVIGVLTSEVSGKGSNWTASSRAPHDPGSRGLQTHNETSAEDARRKAIATLRAWVVRNVQDNATRAKQESMEPGPAEQRALELMRTLDGGRVVRYRGGAWARPGLRTEGPGDLPVLTATDASTGITVLRKLALKGLVRLDEEKGEAILN